MTQKTLKMTPEDSDSKLMTRDSRLMTRDLGLGPWKKQ